MGALASGAAAAVGTGAFTSIEADRDIQVDVAHDSDAFLALGPSEDDNGAYVDESGGIVSLDFTETEAGGEGINDRAFTNFESVLEVENQGTQEVKIGVDVPDEDGFDVGDFLVFVSRENLEYGTGSPSEGEQGIRTDNFSVDELPEIGPGEGITIGFAFNLDKDDDFPELDDTLTIVAGTEDNFPA
ncbi:hypothetical protein SAMN05443661_102114 [Natronobacterium gregoryi]|nr:hypothetical protein Natgr_1967 [Natronobacterium gregoryi SP2]SFI60111.1 hypothetical protein SAMN05443661_102114 [Natronobacterium gregoryi]